MQAAGDRGEVDVLERRFDRCEALAGRAVADDIDERPAGDKRRRDHRIRRLRGVEFGSRDRLLPDAPFQPPREPERSAFSNTRPW